MNASDRDSEDHWLEVKARRLRTKLAELPSAAWCKEASNRKRVRLAAQLRQIEAQIVMRRQNSLFPLNRRQRGENA